MSKITSWFLHNPVAANLLMVFILAAGALSLTTLRVESFPQVPPSELTISVDYPGASARQVDEGITQRIEDAISGVAGIARMTSRSYREHSSIVVKKKTDMSLDTLVEKVRARVDGISGFPQKAQRPRVSRNEFTNLASYVMVYGEVEDDTLQQAAQKTVQALKRHPDISQVTNLGQRQPRLVIELKPAEMRRVGLSVTLLAEAINQWALDFPGGSLMTAQGELRVRGDYNPDSILALRALPVLNSPNGSILLSDVAEIKRTFEQDNSLVRYQGKPAVALLISTSQKDHLFDVSTAIAEVQHAVAPELPQAVSVDTLADMTPYIKQQLDLLGTNAWQGLLIVVLLLGLFLNVRLAFWVALGIPISLAGALALMGPFAYSINDITLFGMILVLGVLVDDAVVVGESIHQARARYPNQPLKAAEEGTKMVSVATVFGVLTTIAAFSPMLWIENELAKVLAGFSAVVIMALVFSMIESKLILPSHLSQVNPVNSRLAPWLEPVALRWRWLRERCNQGLVWVNEKIYCPLLSASLHHRAGALLLFVSFTTLAYGLWSNGNIRSVFFPEIPGRYVTAKVDMNLDAPWVLTRHNANMLEAALNRANQELQHTFELQTPPVQRQLLAMDDALSIELVAELSKEALAHMPAQALITRWQAAAGQLEGSYAVKYSAAESLAGGAALHISATDRALAVQVAAELKRTLKDYPGVQEIFDDGRGGERQLEVRVNQYGRQLGVTQAQVATLVRGHFGGLELKRLLHQGEETRLVMRLPAQARKTQAQLMQTQVHLSGQHFVPLAEVADISVTRAPGVIYRHNRDEVVTVYWRQDKQQMSPEAVWQSYQEQALPALLSRYPGVEIKAAGEFEQQSTVQKGLNKALILTLLLIYVLLAVPLKSYWQPLVIMSVIPFGYAGAVLGHGIMDLPISLLSMFGMMAMTGVVINDSLVLMTRFNQLVEQGMAVKEALVEAGASRLRAIFLTTVTTVCGLMPLLMESSEQAQYLKPAAVSLVFGELFATPITLILLPLILSWGKYKKAREMQIQEYS